MRTGWVVDRRYLRSVGRYTKPPGSTPVTQVQCTGCVISDRLGRPKVANVALNPRCLWTPLLCEWESITRSSTVCTFTLNLQWQPHSSTWEAVYGDPQSTEMSFLGLTQEELPSEKHLQFELLSCRNVSNIDTDTHTDTYSTLWAAATTSYDEHFHCVCRAEVNIAMEKRLKFRYRHRQTFLYLYTPSPPYNRFWAVLIRMEMKIFHCVCRLEVNIATEKGLQSRFWQNKSRLGLRRCVWESTMLWLSGVVLLIPMFNAIPIKIQQDCVSPSEERLTGTQKQLKPAAHLTREFRHGPMIDAPNSISGSHFGGAQGIAWFGFCFLISDCFRSVCSIA